MNNVFGEKLEFCQCFNNRRQLVLLDGDIILAADYIGPSLTAMKRDDIPDGLVWNCVLKCRVLSGHLIWL